MTKALVLGAGGIIGQHMLLQRPAQSFVKRTPFPLYEACDLSVHENVKALLDRNRPEVVVNLAGQNVVDRVDSGVFDDPDYRVNVGLPAWLAEWCDANGSHLIQVSTQGVFSGDHAPYAPGDTPHPVTAYGHQKLEAERRVAQHKNWTIARVTFVLGVRPFRGLGRVNPLERMFTDPEQRQVNDRWFSPAFAGDVASLLWRLVDNPEPGQVVHLGVPRRVSRYDVAKMANPAATIEPASDDEFPGPRRPVDTTWALGARHDYHHQDLETEIGALRLRWKDAHESSLIQRAIEISLFFGTTIPVAGSKLAQGFHPLHAEVAEDFRRANPVTDDELLDWYRTTEAYVWELSAYHLDQGFNYIGMCRGIREKLMATGKKDILVLGDGIGDLSLHLKAGGFNAVYHDLKESRTAEFARFRHTLHLGDQAPPTLWTDGWNPDLGTEKWDAIIALDYLEHLVNVEDWVRAAQKGLRPDGYLMAQNAFAIGDDEHGGSIPMHLVINNRFEHDWIPLLESLNFVHEVSEWWVKK